MGKKEIGGRKDLYCMYSGAPVERCSRAFNVPGLVGERELKAVQVISHSQVEVSWISAAMFDQ